MDSPSRTTTPDDTAPQEVNPGERSGPAGFVSSTLEELRKVVWPSRQQLFSESVAVILMVSLSAATIAAVDRFYSWASSQVFP
ncbi:preprotein translocase subunit SecE [Synechococcus sp. BSF8S]|uniref:preprotein translocase subunit SecE n=1 Tax=Synechococcales TaxID=1890424 RepID=UPI0016297FE6|nr:MULTISPECIES: preprotein translocase subunit SecE [unclassified Synechococcus]MBC1259887.1 preprotein translocase subunit SecE [Synechococcus sp. BSF8S]MBC1262690.1 preprotein translocase subunit SecE [Synechococcus sp. BSA11S]MCT0248046.1 preprotein translocase subunit SecE [Synechococcus sp. CS-205]